MKRPVWLGVIALCALATGCGGSRDESRSPDSPPRITAITAPPTVVTTVQPTVGPATTTTPPTSAPPTTVPPTAAPVTAPPVTSPPLTSPPVTSPPVTSPPVTSPPVTSPPVTSPPATAPTTTPPSTTVVVTASGAVAECSPTAISGQSGVNVSGAVRCAGGWAVARRGNGNGQADVFHATGEGWVHDGHVSPDDGCAVVALGMTVATAQQLAGPCPSAPAPARVLRAGDTGEGVRALQIALVAQGYPIAADGRFGPRTTAAVRDWQSRQGLEVDGLAGPATQFSLGIGADPSGASASTAPPTTVAATSAPAPTTTAALLAPGTPPACTPAAINASTGRTIGTLQCHAGWAISPPIGCDPAAGCNRVNVFHNLTGGGWVFDGVHRDNCVENLIGSGMSEGVAGQFADFCNGSPQERENILPGSRGPAVVNLQIALVSHGYLLDVDGTYGQRTEASVRDWQSRNGLRVDGIAGPDTQRSLGI